MNKGAGRTRSLRLGALLALTLSFVAGIPELTTAPLGSTPFVAPVAALSYVRVSSLNAPTRATSISMPRIGISMPIRGGALRTTISSRYAYHYPTTSWPGGHSNTYLYAHARSGAFLNLKYARRGDLVVVRLATGRNVQYKVTGVYSVAWNAGRWVLPTSSERITLQTCLGNTRTSRRLIVTAVPAY